MSIDFYSRLEPQEPSSKSSSSEVDFYSRVKKPKSQLEKVGRKAAQYGIGAAETALFPYELAVTPLKFKSAQQVPYRENLFSDIEDLSLQKQSGDWSEKDEELLQHLIEQVKDPKKAEQFIQTADIGVGDLAEKASKKLFDYDLEPEGFGENAARIVGNLLSPSGATKLAKKLPELGRKIVDKEFRHAIKEQKNWNRLAKAAEGNAEKETLLKFAQDTKLSPEATTLLFHSEGKADILSKLGSKTKRFKGAVQELKNKLGNNYEELKALGKDGGQLNFKNLDKLTDDLSGLLSEMKSTHVIGPEASPVINTIEKAIESLNNTGSTIKELINSRINLSDSINWGNISRGDFFKKEARNIFANAITEQNPSIGKRLLDTDRAWAKYENFKDVLERKLPTISWKGLKLPAPLVEAMVFSGAALTPFIGSTASAGAFAIKQLIQRISVELAINPKFQKPLQLWRKALMQGSTEGQKKAFLMIKNLAKKEAPEVYEDLKDIDLD